MTVKRARGFDLPDGALETGTGRNYLMAHRRPEKYVGRSGTRAMALVSNPLTQALQHTDWNKKFAEWHRPPSEAEEDRVQRAARMVRDAIKADPGLPNSEIDVIPQGSYHNNTNVRLNSDMDLCVRYAPQFWWYAPPDAGLTAAGLRITPLTPETVADTASLLKRLVFRALLANFGTDNVRWAGKALKLSRVEGSRVDADVVPALGYRLYRGSGLLSLLPIMGTTIYTDDGRWICNFPEQHYERGQEKNERTGRRYKRVVRILKRLSGELTLASPPPSFLIESLVYNCPDELFAGDDWHGTVWRVLMWICEEMGDATRAASLVEANGINSLFGSDQPWTRERVKTFALSALLHVRTP